jgi:hypothetical protein
LEDLYYNKKIFCSNLLYWVYIQGFSRRYLGTIYFVNDIYENFYYSGNNNMSYFDAWCCKFPFNFIYRIVIIGTNMFMPTTELFLWLQLKVLGYIIFYSLCFTFFAFFHMSSWGLQLELVLPFSLPHLNDFLFTNPKEDKKCNHIACNIKYELNVDLQMYTYIMMPFEEKYLHYIFFIAGAIDFLLSKPSNILCSSFHMVHSYINIFILKYKFALWLPRFVCIHDSVIFIYLPYRSYHHEKLFSLF